MNLITWNRKMAFRKKFHSIMEYNPDILVVPECESLDKLEVVKEKLNYTDAVWVGNNPNKGIGVFAFKGLKLELHETHNEDLKYLVPIRVSKDEIHFFNLLAVWVQKGPKNYTEYTHQAIEHYTDFLKKGAILMGDFNSNKIWDRNSSIGNHTKTVELLSSLNIHSVYHHIRKEKQGEELESTFFMYHHEDKGYHIDYCFASEQLLENIESVRVGSHKEWHKLSDHCPVFIHLKSDD